MTRLSLLALVVALGACAGPAVIPTRADLEARVAENPSDVEALRDLGALLTLEEQYGPALGAFSQALEIDPNDGQTLYFVGLANEALGQTDEAENAYARYLNVQAGDVYRDSLRGRLNGLVRARLQSEFAAALLVEDDVADVAGTGVIGVLPFAYRGDNEEYSALGRGLAEVLSIDLASVDLEVVERARLQALLAEYELAEQGVLDASTVPRVGRLLRADKLVGGEVDVQGEALRIESAVWLDGLREFETTEGTVEDLFEVQKTITVAVLQRLGVTLSESEQARILEAPTTDLLAFLLYSRALLLEDDGDFQGAAELYGQALARDPSFALAAEAQAEADVSSAGSQPPGPTLNVAVNGTIDPVGLPNVDVVRLRADALRGTLGGHITPGPETREPGVEGNRAGVLGPLPGPPPVPPRQGNQP
ncbi:CsgG/HfaB family protein [Rubrivirga sp.]|uniref:CsgG/HfaB family protein n=1 Tax=Rubrivirga sp. TaxID=1885344 RepID=UPI003C796CA5